MKAVQKSECLWVVEFPNGKQRSNLAFESEGAAISSMYLTVDYLDKCADLISFTGDPIPDDEMELNVRYARAKAIEIDGC